MMFQSVSESKLFDHLRPVSTVDPVYEPWNPHPPVICTFSKSLLC